MYKGSFEEITELDEEQLYSTIVNTDKNLTKQGISSDFKSGNLQKEKKEPLYDLTNFLKKDEKEGKGNLDTERSFGNQFTRLKLDGNFVVSKTGPSPKDKENKNMFNRSRENSPHELLTQNFFKKFKNKKKSKLSIQRKDDKGNDRIKEIIDFNNVIMFSGGSNKMERKKGQFKPIVKQFDSKSKSSSKKRLKDSFKSEVSRNVHKDFSCFNTGYTSKRRTGKSLKRKTSLASNIQLFH